MAGENRRPNISGFKPAREPRIHSLHLMLYPGQLERLQQASRAAGVSVNQWLCSAVDYMAGSKYAAGGRKWSGERVLVHFKVTEAERKLLRADAAGAGVSMNDWISATVDYLTGVR